MAQDAEPEPQPTAFATREELTREQLLAAPVRWPRPSRLRKPIAARSRLAEALRGIGLGTVGDLLEHLPRDRREARAVAELRPGEQATVEVEVRTIAARPVRTRSGTPSGAHPEGHKQAGRRGMRGLVEATVFDASGEVRATFFNQPWLATKYPAGTRLVLHGKAGAGGRFKVAHHAPGAELGGGGQLGRGGQVGGVGQAGEAARDGGSLAGSVAHYPAGEGVSSTQLLTLVRAAGERFKDVPEPLAGSVRATEQLSTRGAALAAIHFPDRVPDRDEVAAEGLRRLAYDELLLCQLAFLLRRRRRAQELRSRPLCEPPALTERWMEGSLPFALTGDQGRAIARIGADLEAGTPMQRLLMGEVGSGKTVVALWAMLRAVEHGAQAALMAPTETLAEQHFATLQGLLGAEPVRMALLTGSTAAARRADTLAKLASGELSLIVGTHALIEPDVAFAELAVAVVDEQHRFGVRQRAALEAKGGEKRPHTLHMTATPIPRTLALARYGDLDRTLLRELPRGRRPIETRIVLGEQGRAQAYETLREQLDAGRQAYVVCPLVEGAAGGDAAGQEAAGRVAGAGAREGAAGEAHPDGHTLWGAGRRAAKAEFERLCAGELAGRPLALLHGQMRPREKQAAMERFASGQAQALVATTVIEVGVDVPNATVMLVENAERFGISQLHQLRGRVGRGEHASLCLLAGPPGSARLRAVAENGDGFRLAEIDLRLRKEGELIGTRQSGVEQFRFASLPRDAELLERARARAEAILAEDPALEGPVHGMLGEALREHPSLGPDVAAPLHA